MIKICYILVIHMILFSDDDGDDDDGDDDDGDDDDGDDDGGEEKYIAIHALLCLS